MGDPIDNFYYDMTGAYSRNTATGLGTEPSAHERSPAGNGEGVHTGLARTRSGTWAGAGDCSHVKTLNPPKIVTDQDATDFIDQCVNRNADGDYTQLSASGSSWVGDQQHSGAMTPPTLSQHASAGRHAGTPTTGSSPRRRNPWGNQSYSELITEAIMSNPHHRLTLAEIYEWFIANVPYFSEKAEPASAAGWKNSIRHNLSLHSKFMRVPNVETGRSSWWKVDLSQVQAQAGSPNSAGYGNQEQSGSHIDCGEEEQQVASAGSSYAQGPTRSDYLSCETAPLEGRRRTALSDAGTAPVMSVRERVRSQIKNMRVDTRQANANSTGHQHEQISHMAVDPAAENASAAPYFPGADVLVQGFQSVSGVNGVSAMSGSVGGLLQVPRPGLEQARSCDENHFCSFRQRTVSNLSDNCLPTAGGAALVWPRSHSYYDVPGHELQQHFGAAADQSAQANDQFMDTSVSGASTMLGQLVQTTLHLGSQDPLTAAQNDANIGAFYSVWDCPPVDTTPLAEYSPPGVNRHSQAHSLSPYYGTSPQHAHVSPAASNVSECGSTSGQMSLMSLQQSCSPVPPSQLMNPCDHNAQTMNDRGQPAGSSATYAQLSNMQVGTAPRHSGGVLINNSGEVVPSPIWKTASAVRCDIVQVLEHEMKAAGGQIDMSLDDVVMMATTPVSRHGDLGFVYPPNSSS